MSLHNYYSTVHYLHNIFYVYISIMHMKVQSLHFKNVLNVKYSLKLQSIHSINIT